MNSLQRHSPFFVADPSLDPDFADTHRQFDGILRAVGGIDAVVVNQHKIGGQALTNKAAIPETQPSGRFSSDMIDSSLQRHDLHVAHIMAEEAGIA